MQTIVSHLNVRFVSLSDFSCFGYCCTAFARFLLFFCFVLFGYKLSIVVLCLGLNWRVFVCVCVLCEKQKKRLTIN